jgi:hypothetical protein
MSILTVYVSIYFLNIHNLEVHSHLSKVGGAKIAAIVLIPQAQSC